MSQDNEPALMAQAAAAFQALYGAPPETVAFAPGRVNLLGEHTDYNGGYVLPMPLALGTAVACGRGGAPGSLRIASDSFDGEETRAISETASGAWSDYVLGSMKALAAEGIAADGVQALIASNLPVGAGLSSSAAIEVATLRAAGALVGKTLDPVELATVARSVEKDFVGMPCGIMDQFAVSVGTTGNALFLDTRRLKHQPAPLPEGYRFLVIHSGVSHKLTDDGYATRVAECTAACAALDVEMLSDLGTSDLPRIAQIEAPLNKRARHIVTENQRVLDAVDALSQGDAAHFARLMNESHDSQRDDYDVSVAEVDELVAGATAAGALGARLTGGGFGGSIVALVAGDRVKEVGDQIASGFPRSRLLAVT